MLDPVNRAGTPHGREGGQEDYARMTKVCALQMWAIPGDS